MYTKIVITRNIRSTLHYHENKLLQGKAECLYAGNFLKDADQLSWEDKLYHFERLNERNDRVEKNTVHLFLTFHRSDELSNDRMREISREYMREMRLEEQPYLVYRHYDTSHPHAHVVCNNVRYDGTRLTLERADFFHSKKITEELEQKYGLTQSGIRISDEEWQQQQHLQKVQYGETSLYAAFSGVLKEVIPEYAYTSLEELNSVLRPYNMMADRGSEGSYLYQHRGLLYRPLDEEGHGGSAFIKASVLKDKPTLQQLEERYAVNESLREPFRQHITTAIDWAFAGAQLSAEAFRRELEKEGISVVHRQDKNGGQHVCYVDHESKSVFDGASLGEKYTATAISQRCIPEEDYRQQQELTERQRQRHHHRQQLYGDF